jgi:hypothetical protein
VNSSLARVARTQAWHLRRAVQRRAHGWRRATARWRRPPDFLIVGAQRAGTTSLYWALAELPMVLPAARKEVHYFDSDHWGDPSWYLGHFPLRLRSPRRAWVTGEATPYLSFFPPAPARVARALPDIKVVLVLRDPIDRAYSQFVMERGRGERRPFLEAALDTAEVDRIHAALVAGATVSAADLQVHRSRSYLQRGLYAEQLRRWHDHVPAAQILPIDFARLSVEPTAVLRQTASFIGASGPAADAVTVARRNEQVGRDRPVGYDEWHRQLRPYFRESDAELAELLRWRPSWMEAAAAGP